MLFRSLDVNCYGLTKSLRICGVTTQKENGTFVSYTYEGMPVTINVPYTTMNEFTGVSDYFFLHTDVFFPSVLPLCQQHPDCLSSLAQMMWLE